jgi:hypothetical protein
LELRERERERATDRQTDRQTETRSLPLDLVVTIVLPSCEHLAASTLWSVLRLRKVQARQVTPIRFICGQLGWIPIVPQAAMLLPLASEWPSRKVSPLCLLPQQRVDADSSRPRHLRKAQRPLVRLSLIRPLLHTCQGFVHPLYVRTQHPVLRRRPHPHQQ